MRLININDQKTWEKYVGGQSHASFLQSWSWGEFQKSVGHRPYRWAVTDDQGKWLTMAQVFEQTLSLKLGTFFYLPRGPLWPAQLNAQARQRAWRLMIEESKKHRAIFLRFDPLMTADVDALSGYKLKQVKDLQPAATSILDLKLSTEELLAKLHQKTRYNIRLAERKGVEVKIEPATVETLNKVFWPLLRETAKRDGFRPHQLNYYRQMITVLSGQGQLKILNVYYQKQCLVSYLLIYYGDTVTYLHGASSDKHRNFMVTYLAQWHAIIDAKTQGYHYYDFWGIAPDNMAQHPLAGVTRFKNNFGGRQQIYPGTFELILKPWIYSAYRLLKKLR